MIHKASFYFLLAVVTLTTLTACNRNSEFTRQKWAATDGLEYSMRDQILEDLMANHKIKGLTFDQVIDSLGSPQRRDSLKFTYQILDNSFQFGQKKPVYKKNLVIHFSKDSIVTKFDVSEFKAKKKEDK